MNDTPNPPEAKPTEAMLKWFRRANDRGQIRHGSNNGLARASWRRLMERATEMGFVTPNPFGEYELTPAGIAARDANPDPDAPTPTPSP